MRDPAIEIRGLEKSFSRFKLGPLDLNVPRGAIYGLIGPNGAGKTTTIDLIMGMGRESAGTIRVLGFDHIKEEVEMKRRTGYVSQDIYYDAWKKVGRIVNFFRGFYPDWDDVYCRRLLDSLKLDWGAKIPTLSFGERTKLSLILALSHRPELLLLDEPTAGLDALSKRQIFGELLEAVQDENRTVLISSHGLADVERFTDHIGIINNGKLLLEGRTTEIVERYKLVDFHSPDGFNPENITGIFVQEQQENRWRVMMDMQGEALDQIKALGATDISTAPVTLEDIFVALVREE